MKTSSPPLIPGKLYHIHFEKLEHNYDNEGTCIAMRIEKSQTVMYSEPLFKIAAAAVSERPAHYKSIIEQILENQNVDLVELDDVIMYVANETDKEECHKILYKGKTGYVHKDTIFTKPCIKTF
jgi:hypothetical protein